MNDQAARLNTTETAGLMEQELIDYLEPLSQSMAVEYRLGTTNCRFSSNPVVDALLQYYNVSASEKGKAKKALEDYLFAAARGMEYA